MACTNDLVMNCVLEKKRQNRFISIQNYKETREGILGGYVGTCSQNFPKKIKIKNKKTVPTSVSKFWFFKPSRRHRNGSVWPRKTNNKHSLNSRFGFSIVSGLATLTFYQLPDFNVRKEAVPLSKYTQLFANRWWAIWSALSNSSVQIR